MRLFKKNSQLKMTIPLYGGGSIDVEFHSLVTDLNKYALEVFITGRDKDDRAKEFQKGQIFLTKDMVNLIKQLGTPVERTKNG